MANGGGGARASDAERQKVIELLRHHTGAGRLTLDEFADRAGDVYASVTREDLAQVVVDLPEGVRPEVGPTAATAPPAFAAPSPTTAPLPSKRRRFVAIMGSSENRGRWRAPDEMSAFAFWGAVKLDLRNALIESAVVEIRAVSIMGNVEVVVPPGIPVEINGLVIMGSSTSRVRAEELIPGAPLVRIRARGLWGAVVARNPRRRAGQAGRERELQDAARRPSRDDRRRDGECHPLLGGRGQRHRMRQQQRQQRQQQRQQVQADVHRLVEDAIGVARGAVDRALGPGSVSDRIPDMPTPDAAPAGATLAADAQAPSSSGAAGPDGAAPGAATDGATPNGAIANGAIANGAAAPGRIPHGTLTILVSDIADSTRMTEQLGDQDWIKVLEAHNEIVRRQVADQGGTEVKAQGDGFLFVFPSARAAVLAAIGVQRAMADFRRHRPDAPIDLRVGLHTGEVVATEDDVFGHNVVVASRIADAAAPGEIVVSGLTRDLTASASDLGYDDGVDVTLKGVSRPWRVHRVRWT